MKNIVAIIIALVSKWFLWAVGQKPKIADAEGAGEAEGKLKDQLKKEGW